jgi:N-acetylmuramic acid 6-phosphate etherase
VSATEAHRPELADLDLRSTRELVALAAREDALVPEAVARAGDAVARAIEAIVGRLARGGRLVYVGAGTSGLLAALDAAECAPTFSCPAGQVLALVAGGADLSRPLDSSAEDDAEAGRRDVRAAGVGADDVVVGVSASGRTAYTVAAVRQAVAAGALSVAVVCAEGSELAAVAEHEVAVPVGPELVAGSTRLKAGTAQKLVLNTLSTVTMIRLGKTYGNLMVDVDPGNAKLRGRARRAVELAAGVSPADAEAALAAAGGDAKVAIVALVGGVDAAGARERLYAAGGVVRRALENRS